jgi:hypothetical protein
MKNSNSDNITQIIENFLIAIPSPTASDWKHLIDANSEHANAIVDAAMAHGSTENDMHATFNEKVFNSTISNVLNLVHSIPSPVLKLAEEKVVSIQGASVRKVAQEIGIGSYVQLLNGILVGRIHAPKLILTRLGDRLEVPIAALSELFSQRFSVSEVAAFKSPDGKPEVRLKPYTWEEAVKAIDLPKSETSRLLNLADEEVN